VPECDDHVRSVHRQRLYWEGAPDRPLGRRRGDYGEDLRRCAEAAVNGGAVFVVEKIGADGESLRTGMDLRMLAYFGGRERGVAELAALAETSGLRVVAVHPAGDLAIVELTAL